MSDYEFVYIAVMGWFLLNTLIAALPLPCLRKMKQSSTAWLPPAVIPAGIMVIKGISKIFGNKSKSDAEKAAQLAYNEWLKDRSQNVDDIIKNLKDRGIDIYGPQVTTSNSQAASEVHSVMNQSTQMKKTVGQGQQPMYNKLNQLLTGRLGQTDFVTPEERAASESQINKMQLAGRERVGNAISRMGLPPSSMQAAMLETPSDVAANQARLQALANFANINREQSAQARAEASGQLQAWQGANTNTHGTTDTFSNSSSSNTTTAPPDYMKLLNFLQPPSPKATGKTGYSLAGDIMGTGADVAGSIYNWNQMNQGGSPMSWNSPGGQAPMPGSPNFPIITGQEDLGPYGHAAGGGDFVTTRPTNITVGDNPGGQELISIRPISGAGQTRIDPASGLIALKRLLASRRA